MSTWFIPVLKSVLPYVGTIVSAAAPVFTAKTADAAASQAFLQKQIAELQSAASANDTHIRELAVQMQKTLASLEQGASLAEKQQRQIVWLCAAAIFLSALACLVVLYGYVAR